MAGRIERLLDVAGEEFAIGGFEGTSLDRIVERSGVSKTTIFRRFGNKEGLFRTLVARTLVSIETGLHAAEREMDVTNPHGSIARFITQYVDHAIRNPMGHALLAIAVLERQTFPTLGHTIFAGAIEGLAPIVRYIAALIEEGVLAPQDPVEAALDLQALMSQGMRAMVDEPGFLDGDGRAEAISRRFLRGWG